MRSLDHHPRIARRWPVVMAQTAGVDLIEEGLGGRLAAGHGDPIMGPHMDGQLGLRITLASHGPIDLLTIMLGTNDQQAHHAKSPEQIAGHVSALIKIAQTAELQDRHGGFAVLLICPPPVLVRGVFAADFGDGGTLGTHYARVAATRGVYFMDAGAHIASSDIDGIHFDEAAHITLGQAVADQIKAILI